MLREPYVRAKILSSYRSMKQSEPLRFALLVVGLTQHTQRGHIARACLEATCFQAKAILQAMEKDSGQRVHQLAVDGGMSDSDLCMQVWRNLSMCKQECQLTVISDSSGHCRNPS